MVHSALESVGPQMRFNLESPWLHLIIHEWLLYEWSTVNKVSRMPKECHWETADYNAKSVLRKSASSRFATVCIFSGFCRR
jgi:hypothetical protein